MGPSTTARSDEPSILGGPCISSPWSTAESRLATSDPGRAAIHSNGRGRAGALARWPEVELGAGVGARRGSTHARLSDGCRGCASARGGAKNSGAGASRPGPLIGCATTGSERRRAAARRGTGQGRPGHRQRTQAANVRHPFPLTGGAGLPRPSMNQTPISWKNPGTVIGRLAGSQRRGVPSASVGRARQGYISPTYANLRRK